MFDFYQKDEIKARRFAKAMAGLRKSDRHLDSLLQNEFDCSAVNGTVVGCGGGNGHIANLLAEVRQPA
jgi:hypothetical protein